MPHKEDCRCPVCRSARGERRATGIRVEFRLHGERAQALREMAESQGRSISDIAKRIVVEHLAK